MGTALFLVGILGIVGAIAWFIISLFKKSTNRKPATLFIISVVVMIVGVINVDEPEDGKAASANTTTTTEETSNDTSKKIEASKEKEAEQSKEKENKESKEAKESDKKTEESKKKEEAENIDESFEFDDFNFEIYGAKINDKSITLYMEYENMGYTDETPPISAVAVDVEQNGENLSSDNDAIKSRGEDKTGAYADVKLGTKMPFTETFELENKKDDLEISIVPMLSDEEPKKTKIELN